MQIHFEQRGEKGWGGFLRGTVDMLTVNQFNGIARRCYVLYVKLDATAEELAIIRRYDLGGVIFNAPKDLDDSDFTQFVDPGLMGSGFDTFVHLDKVLVGYEVKLPPRHEIVREVQDVIERHAKGLNNAIKNRMHSLSEGTSKSVNLDD